VCVARWQYPVRISIVAVSQSSLSGSFNLNSATSLLGHSESSHLDPWPSYTHPTTFLPSLTPSLTAVENPYVRL
jgi:hypothetical protein